MKILEWILANGDNLQIVSLVACFVILGILERVIPRRSSTMERPVRWKTNWVLTVLNIVVLMLLPFSLLTAAFWAESAGWGVLNRVALPLVLLVPVHLLARGFISFFTHYLMHKVPLFWRLHRIHHLDTELDVTTTIRFHPLEFVVSLLPGLVIVVVVGLNPWVLALYELLDVVVTLFSHANIRLPGRLERIVRLLVVTPDLHRVHHSSWQPETDSNFSAVFPVWDMVFGTYRVETREDQGTMRLGLDEVRGPGAHDLKWLLGSIMNRELRVSGQL